MIRAASLSLLCFVAAPPGYATVYEFTSEGQLRVNGSPVTNVRPQAQTEQVAQTARPVAVSASRAVYRDMAEQVALQHAGGAGPRRAGLDALTFAKVFVELIRAESGFNPRARSPKGAQGLGQLMPDTARLLGVRDAWDPEQNLDGAARYFTAQLERFGTVPHALAAYNAGPHRVVQYGGVPPYRETRAYVARITTAVGSVQTVNPAPVPPAAGQTVLSTKSQKDSSVWQY